MPASKAAAPASAHEEISLDLNLWRIDPATQETLRAVWPKVADDITPLLDDFYAFMRHVPAVQPLLADAAKVDRLKVSQKELWRDFFSARFDDSYLQRGRAIGAAHHRVGLKPRHYLAGYTYILERLVTQAIERAGRDRGRAVRETSSLIRGLMMDAELALSVYYDAAMSGQVRDEMQDFADVFEDELDDAVEFVRRSAANMERAAGEVLEAARQVSTDSGQVSAATHQVNASSQTIAQASEGVAAAIARIAREVEQSTDSVSQAVTMSRQSRELANHLTSVSERIGAIVQLIERISKETRMLALNATIEAARAGEAGRGFSVVAQEVKNLADQTNRATADIRSEIGAMQDAIGQTVDAIGHVAEQVDSVTQRIDTIAEAVAEQESLTRDIARSASETAQGIRDVDNTITSVVQEADRSTVQSGDLYDNSHVLVGQVRGIKRRVTATLRGTRFANRRREDRIATDIPVAIEFAGHRGTGLIENISAGGAQVREAGIRPDATGTIALDIQELGRVRGTVVAAESEVAHVRFDIPDADFARRLETAMARWRQADHELIEVAQRTAEEIGELFEAAVAHGEITLDALFDASYQPVPDSNPPQFLTSFTDLCDRLLPAAQEPLLTRHSRITFCAAVDRNGYLPTHNRKYSQPQRPGQTVWNTANCRHRRIFDDRTGLAAARGRGPVLVQTYRRDMGGGEIATMKDISAPIMVRGRHWGGFRIGCRT
ncbi:MAG TPA: methyl-accepting chemotaxis protein [Azospirillaceae bacterium]|nr:methyl-accepting chemotaxis protein [Azospirillaceae bacterium]